jgi:hypothetical protein
VSETMYERGDTVWCRIASGQWERGIVTDVFVAPLTGVEVVVVNGRGYYADADVVADTPTEPQSLRA